MTDMTYRHLGDSGLMVSTVGLGCNNFGMRIDATATERVVGAALDHGITMFDTSDSYGDSEIFLSKALGPRRSEIVLATKFGSDLRGANGPDWGARGSRRYIRKAVERSLSRLGTDYIDLYQVHSWDAETRVDETLTAMDDLVKSGKVRYVGCSNFLSYQLARSVGRAEVLGVSGFESVQPRYNMLFRENERELFPLCAEENIAVIPYNPLAGGFLSGKHMRGAPTEGGRFTLGFAAGRYQDRYWHERMFDTVDQLRPIADETGVSLATLAVQWVLANPTITSPIIGASRPEQIADPVAAVGNPIDAGIKARIDEMTYEYRFGDNAR